MGKGGGSAPPVQQSSSTSNLPAWAQPYSERLLGKAEDLTNIDKNPYQEYGGQKIADFTPMQQQAFNTIGNMQPNAATGAGVDVAANVARQAGQYGNYQPQQFGNQYQGQNFNNMGLGYLATQNPNLQNFQMQGPQNVRGAQTQAAQLNNAPTYGGTQFQGPQDVRGAQTQAAQLNAAPTYGGTQFQGPQNVAAERVGTQNFNDPATAQSYMNPYTQNVVNIQQREAQRNADIAATTANAQASKAGAFGGSAQAILKAEAARNLATQKGDIQAQGLNTAYNQAQQAFQTDQARQLQAQQANQQTGLQAGMSNQQMGYNTNLQNAQLGQQTGLANQALAGQYGLQQGQFNQAANLANQQTRQQADLANQQMGYNTNLQNAQLGQQAGLANQQMAGQYGLQQGQFNQAANLANQQTRQQANLANQQMGYNVGNTNLQAQLGVQQLGSGQNMQSQLANQGAYGQMQGLGMQQNLANNAQNMQNAQLAAQYGLAGQQAGEQSRQFGSNLGLQGLQQQLAAAGQLGTLGQSQYNQMMGIAGAQQTAGAQQQAMRQQQLTDQYQNWLNSQNYQYKQLGFMSDILHGTPTGGTTLAQSTAAPPNMMGQIAGLGLGVGSLLTGASNAGIGKKEGGVIKGYKKGGAVQHFDEGGITSLLTDPSTELAAKMPPNRPPITTAEALAKFMLPVIQKMHQPIATPGTTTVAEDMAMEILGRKQQQQQMAQAPEQQQLQQMAMQEQMPQEQQMQDTASGGLASLPAANFNDDSFVGGGIIAFADEGEVPEPKGDEKPKSDDKPKRVRGKKGVAPVTPVEVTPSEPVKPAAPAASTAAPTKSPAQVAAEADAEFRARQGVASGQSAEPQSRLSKIRGALQPTTLNPNVTTGGGILSGLGKVAKYAGKSVGPLAAYGLADTALDLANTPTDTIREYYGDQGEPSFLGDVGIRSRAALGSLMPFSDTAEGLRALRQKQIQTAAPVVPETTPEKDKSGLTADQRAAAFIAGIGGGGGGAGGGGGSRAGAGGAGAGNAVANTGFSPELKLIMENRKADRAAREAEVKANAPKGLEDYIKAEENIYAKAGIGNAAKEEKERLNARLAGMQGEQKAAFLRDLSKAGFAMAQNASQHGATFLGSAAAGGMNFSESNAKTAEHFANLNETLASSKAKLAQADEAVRAGMIAKGSAEHKEAQKEYATARNKVMELNEKMSDADLLAYRALEVANRQMQSQENVANINANSRLQAARIGQGNKDVVENQLKRAYAAAIGKGDNAAAQAILKQLQAVTEAVNPQRFTAPPKQLDPTQILGLRAQLKLAKKNKDDEGIALYSSLLAPYMPSEAAAGAGAGVPADLAKKYGL